MFLDSFIDAFEFDPFEVGNPMTLGLIEETYNQHNEPRDESLFQTEYLAEWLDYPSIDDEESWLY